MAVYELYIDPISEMWCLNYDGDNVAIRETYEEINQDFRAFMVLDAAIGNATNNYIVEIREDGVEVRHPVS